MNNEIIIWQCTKCEDIQISNPRQHHQMETCKCGLAGIDLERYMWRAQSPDLIFELKRINLDVMDVFYELLRCCVEQGFYLEIDKKYVTLETVMILNDLEREIFMEMIK